MKEVIKKIAKKIICLIATPEYLWKYKIHRKWEL